MALASPRGQSATVWTGDCSQTVEIWRLAGPKSGVHQVPARLLGLPPEQPGHWWDLGSVRSKSLLYGNCLASGSCWDIYRWVDLEGVARVWPLIEVPPGVRAEWTRALQDAGLLCRSDGSGTVGHPVTAGSTVSYRRGRGLFDNDLSTLAHRHRAQRRAAGRPR